MPIWQPQEKWKDKEVFIIGGGPSLRKFDWELLKPELTIGCNTAFMLGSDICKVCVFGDRNWFDVFEAKLVKFKGAVFTNCVSLLHTKHPWLWTMSRQQSGLSRTALGWSNNTGVVAINLAFLLGARCVYLLGFDMRRTVEHSNWHNWIVNEAQVAPKVYQLFQLEYKKVVQSWHTVFPDREIFNVTCSSALTPEYFPWLDPDDFWAARGVKQMGFTEVVV